jgi:hypothetical protein
VCRAERPPLVPGNGPGSSAACHHADEAAGLRLPIRAA